MTWKNSLRILGCSLFLTAAFAPAPARAESPLAFSHFHFDHTGNANAFGASTWIVNKAELAWAGSTPTPFGVDPSTFSALKTAKTQLIDGDFDVFGDGGVRILKAPGHTPGHGVLAVKLHDQRDVATLPKFPAYLE
jgi:glyoxylase-like metal-dependent hydrolase (beta-lactamase superfamily II)